MWQKFSLKVKLIGAFAGSALVLMIVGGLSVYYLSEVASNYSWVSEVNLPKIEYMGNINGYIRDINIQVTRVYENDINDAELSKVEDLLKDAVAALLKDSQGYESLPFVEGEGELWKAVTEARQTLIEPAKKALELSKTHKKEDMEARDKVIANEFQPTRVKFREAFDKSLNFVKQRAKLKVEIAESAASRAKSMVIILVSLGFLAAIILGLVISQTLSRAISEIAESLAIGAEETAGASSQLSSASQQLSSGSSEAAASLEETVASLEELSSMVHQNAENAKEAGLLSSKSRVSAEQGDLEIQKLIAAMSEMGQGAKKIEEIINVIDDIAFQTNLLALNAAVEAARAGDQGKGFAVVAEAVRNLAQRSASAAKDITQLIKQNVESAENGSRVAETSGSVLKEIVDSVKKVADLNAEIAGASQEQSSGLSQISQAMNQLDQATQGNASSSEEVAASSEEMSAQAQELKQSALELRIIVHGKDFQNSVNSRFGGARINKKSLPSQSEAKIISFQKKSDAIKPDLEGALSLDKPSAINGTKGF